MLARVNDFLKSIQAKIELLLADDRKKDILVRVEANKAIADLKIILSDLVARASSLKDIEPETGASKISAFFEPLSQLLQDRWRKYNNTDVICPLNDRISASIVYHQVATGLAELSGGHAYDYLMPDTTPATSNFISNIPLSSLKLTQFIFTDDGHPLHVGKCLDDAASNKDIYRRFDGIGSNKNFILYYEDAKGFKRRLTAGEYDRVKNHSREAREYCETIEFNNRVRFVGADDTYVGQKRAEFYAVYGTDNYRVLSTYGDEGKKRLCRVLLAQVKSRDDLAAFLASYVDTAEWKLFLSHINSEDYFRIVLGMRTEEFTKTTWIYDAEAGLKQLLASKFSFIEDEGHIRATLICLNEAYRRIRKDGPEFKTYAGQLVGSYMPKFFGSYTSILPSAVKSYSKAEKLAACDVLADFYMSEHMLNELNVYLQRRNLTQYQDMISSDTLGLITQKGNELYAGLRQSHRVMRAGRG